ncbi:MAG TPA: DUF5801 repeats-in-toxin domain-containing protein [Sphingomicrobium sp.]
MNGSFGSLAIDAQGNYTYTVNPNAGGGGVDVFTYTLTDGDGDTTTATLTITNPDLFPNLPDPAVANLDDDVIPGADGIPDGPGDDDPDVVGENSVNGQLVGSGGDGDLDYAFTGTNTLPAGFTVNPVNASTVQILQGGTVVLTVTLNTETGAYTVVQNAPIDHPAGSDENNLSFGIGVRVVDVDGDSEPATITINVDDDTPEMNRADVSVPTLTVDETDLATNASADYSVVFDGAYGADGPGTTSYAVSVVNGTDSGLVDVASGDAILLFMNGSVVEGRVGGADGPVAFTVSVDSGTGVVTLDQIRALEHPDTNDHDEPVNAIADSIQLTATITDGDGDTDSLSVNIGHTLGFEDDGPSIDRNQAAAPVLVTDDTDTPNDVAGPANFAALFTGVFGADGFKDADDNDVEDADAIRFALSIGGPNGTDSGLNDTLTGDNILLRVVGNTIEGYLEGSPATVAFTITLDPNTGQATLEQDRAVVHDNPADPVESGDSAATLAANLVVITATIEDGDGDTDTATANVGNSFRFEDDGPSIDRNQAAVPELVTDDTNTPNDTDSASFAGLFTGAFGKDGFKDSDDNDVEDANAISYGLSLKNGNGTDSGLNDVLTGDNILLRVVGNTIEGYLEGSPATVAFTLTLNPDTGQITQEQDRAITHDDPTDPVESGDDAETMAADLIVLTATITDGDGDTDTATANIGGAFNFEDDGPAAQNDGSLGTFDDGATNVNIGTVAGLLANDDFGADGEGSPRITIATGSLGGTITIDGSGNLLYTSNHDVTPGDTDVETFTYTIRDGDGDTATATFTVSLTDNRPSIGTTEIAVDEEGLAGGIAGTVYGDSSDLAGQETSQSGQLTGLNFGGDGQGDIVLAGSNNTGLVTLKGETVKSVWDGASHTLTGYADTNGNNVMDPGETPVFTLQITNVANGSYTFTLLQPVRHNAANTEDNETFSVAVTVTDSEGDPAVGSIDILIDDDSPTLDRNATLVPTLVTDDTDTPNDTAGPVNFAALFTGAFGADGAKDSNNDSVEDADALRFALSLKNGDGTVSGLTDVLTGDAIHLRINANGDVEGYVSSNPALIAFTIDLDPATGQITLEQDRAITHNDPADPIETGGSAAQMAADLVVLTATIEDDDGDTDTATADIGGAFRFEDDGPSIDRNQAPVPQLVTDDTDTPNDTAGPANFAALFSGVFGKDSFKDSDDNNVEDADAIRFAFSLKNGNGTVSGLTDVLTGDAIHLRINANGDIEGYVSSDPASVAFIIDIDPATGQVTLEQDRAITHNDPNDPVESGSSAAQMAADLIVITATIEDGDGDKDTATANVGDAFRFEDDGPSIDRNSTAVPQLVTDDTDTPDDTAGPANFAALFSGVFGKDGFKDSDDNNVEDADAIRFALSLKNGNGTVSGLTDVLTGDAIHLRINANGDIEGYVSSDPSLIAFTIDLDPATGSVTLEQDRAITHNDPTDPVESGGSAAQMAADLIVITATIEDGDGDKDTATANVGDAFRFEDDGPSIDRNQTGAPVLVTDDTATPNDTASGNFAALFTGLFGKDGFKDSDDNNVEDANAIRFSLSISGPNGTDSGLDDVATGANILLRVVGNTIEGYVEGSPATIAFTITVNPDTGQVTLEQDRAIEHNDPTDPVESGASAATLAADLIVITATIEDGDGDTDTATANIGDSFQFEDDGPSFGPDIDDTLNIENDATPTGTGDLDIDIGADSPNDGNGNNNPDDLSVSGFTIKVNGVDADNVVLTQGAENATTANYSFVFDYPNGDGTTAHGTGTLVFDKAAGTYTVDITSGPIEGFSFSSISTGQPPVGYQDGSSTLMPSNPDVSVVQVDTDLFVQFTGYMETGSGTGANNFKTSPDNDLSAGDDENFANGEVLVQQRDYVTISGLGGNGVHGDTMNKGDILDFDLFTSNPTGFSDQVPTGQVETMFVWLDGIGANEDMIMVLKLYDTVTNTFTTRAVYVGNEDFFKDGSTNAGQYQSLIDNPEFDNNDALVVIEQNDYNTALEPNRYVIVGAQLATTDEGIVGSAINLNGAVGAAGATTGAATTFAADTNDTGFKIKDIGFLTTTTEDQSATIEFDVNIHDADGDTATQHITVNVGDPVAPFAATSSSSQDEQLQKTAANSNNLTMAAAVGAAGMAESAAAEPTYDTAVIRDDTTEISYSNESVEKLSAEDSGSSNALAGKMSEASDASDSVNSSGRGNGNANGHDNQLDAGSNQQSSDDGSSHQAANDQGPAANAEPQVAVPPTVTMVSAEALQAAGLDGEAKQNGSVEKIVAEALGGGDAPTVDGLLAHLSGGLGSVPELAEVASQDAGSVPGWDMAGHGAIGAAADMVFKVDAAMHHDAIQPAVNG